MIVKAFGAAFAADAGIVDAAPGRGRVEAVMVVDPDDAGLDGGRHPMGAADVAGADRGRKTERGIIGEAQRVGLVLERRHRGEGPEHFLLEDAHVGFDVGKHRRLDEIAVVMAGHLGRDAAGDQPRAVFMAEARIGQHAIALPRRDHRAELGRGIEGIADPDALGLRLQLFDELVIDRGLHDDGARRRRRSGPRR